MADWLDDLLVQFRGAVEGERQRYQAEIDAAQQEAAELMGLVEQGRVQVRDLHEKVSALDQDNLAVRGELDRTRKLLADCEARTPAPIPDPEPVRREVGRVIMHPGAATYMTFGHHFLPGEGGTRGDSLFVGDEPATAIPINYHPDGSPRHVMITTRAQSGERAIELVNRPDTRIRVAAPSIQLQINGGTAGLQIRDGIASPDLGEVSYTFRHPIGICGSVTVRAYPDDTHVWCVRFDNALATLDRTPATVTFSWTLHVNGTLVDWMSPLSIPYRESRTLYTPTERIGFAAPDLARWKAVGAIPNYADYSDLPNPTLRPSESQILRLARVSAESPDGLVQEAMGSPGGRMDIGMIPGWDVLLLMTGDPRLFSASLKSGAALGLFPAWLRNPTTGAPYSITDFPRSTLANINDNVPASDRIPVLDRAGSIYKLDSSHQPRLGYVPYLLTGFPQFAEGLTFLAHFDLYSMDWRMRRESEGLIGPAKSEMRSETWTMCTVAAAAATALDAATREFFVGVLNRSLTWSWDVEAVDSPLGIIGRVVDTLNRYSPEAQAALKSIYRPWQEDQHTTMLAWLESLGVPGIDTGLVRRVGMWVAGNLMGRWATLGTRDSTVYDLPSELKVADARGRVTGARIRDWDTLVKYERTPDPGVYNPKDPQHYQGIARAAAAAAAGWGVEGAGDVYRELDRVTVTENQQRYIDTPQWLVMPYTDTVKGA